MHPYSSFLAAGCGTMARVHTLPIHTASATYNVLLGEGLLAELPQRLRTIFGERPRRSFVLTSPEIWSLWSRAFLSGFGADAPEPAVLLLPAGEHHKRLAALERLAEQLATAGADRSSLLIAFGGGVIGDLTGFLAAIYMRGIDFIQVPTTLLAQVDSSVGGKTGVNHPAGKNLIGAFHQPSVVVSDTSLLRSLPARELSAGLAEVLKHGLLADDAYFERTVREMPALLALNDEALARAIGRSCQIKAGIVGRDERESGERALLNLGHTFGHAIEALTGFERWLHGEAVGCGLCLAADLSSRLGMIGSAEVERVTDAVARARLPARIEGLSRSAAIDTMRGDKKAYAERIRFVLLQRIGHAIQREAPEALVEATLAAAGYR